MKIKIGAIVLGLVLCMGTTACSAAHGESAFPPPAEESTPLVPIEPSAPNEPAQPQAPSPIAPSGPEETEPPAQENPPSEPQTPSEPPAPPQPTTDDLLASVTNGLRVRAGAGTRYAAVGTLDTSDMVMPVCKTGNWYEIRYRGALGYISASYVKTVSFEKSDEKIERIIDEGKKLLGIPYVFGAQRYHFGNGVRNAKYDGKSYDCSSLMQYIFKVGANINLAMTSREQSLQGTYVAKKDIRRGDLLFFTNASRQNKTGIERIGHVALYLGDNVILHTASDHAVIEPMSATRHGYYISARRFL